MKLAGQGSPFRLLNLHQPDRECVKRSLRRLALGDVTVHGIYRNLSIGHRYGHADHKNVHPAAIFALANRLRIHSLLLRYQFRISLKLISEFAGYDQLAEGAAESLLRSVAKNPGELPVHTDHPNLHIH
jgi:hypothetical protein